MHYFAFGSNMLTARLCARTASARPVGLARLTGWRLAFHKRGADRSGKCDIVPASADDEVIGVVFDMDAGELPALDRCEGAGYRRTLIDVPMDGGPLRCAAYRATDHAIDPMLRPFDWYYRLVLAGLIEHGAGADYIDRVRQTPWRVDSNPVRPARLRALRALARFGRSHPRLAAQVSCEVPGGAVAVPPGM